MIKLLQARVKKQGSNFIVSYESNEILQSNTKQKSCVPQVVSTGDICSCELSRLFSSIESISEMGPAYYRAPCILHSYFTNSVLQFFALEAS